MKNYLNLVVIVLSMMQLYVMEQPVLTKKRKYTVELQHLCPSVPSETAEKCTRSFNIIKNIQKLFNEEQAKKLDGNPNQLPHQWANLAECQLDNLETPSISLEVHCYFEGVKEGLVKFNLDMANTPENISIMFDDIDSQITNAKNRYVRDMLEQVKVELQQAVNTLGDKKFDVGADTPNQV